jgi:hypothetical protein
MGAALGPCKRTRLRDRQSLSSTETARPYDMSAYCVTRPLARATPALGPKVTHAHARMRDRQPLSSTETARPYDINAYSMTRPLARATAHAASL